LSRNQSKDPDRQPQTCDYGGDFEDQAEAAFRRDPAESGIRCQKQQERNACPAQPAKHELNAEAHGDLDAGFGDVRGFRQRR
jgi:hypothetical protein